MVDEKNDWLVRNVVEGRWSENPNFGKVCSFEGTEGKFPEIGVHIFVIEPGRANCRYHRESVQEDFLVISGECKLLVNGEERPLKAWDFVHCGPGVSHVFVGAGDGPCAILMIGRRSEDKTICYPVSEIAAPYGASVEEETFDPKEAYDGTGEWESCSPPAWPLWG